MTSSFDRRYAAIAMVLLAACGASGGTVASHPGPFEDNRAAMAAAADYLVRHLDSAGRFVYRTHAGGRSVKPRYNVLRHAGSIYALADYSSFEPSDELHSAVVRSARYLRERHVMPLADRNDLLAVFSLPDEETRDGHRVAKLGGTALGLVALIAAREQDESIIDVESLRKLGELIRFMQRDDGSFRSKYRDDGRGFDEEFESLYYPGEAMLGLMRLHRIDPDPRWLDAAARAALQLAKTRTDPTDLPPDHWYMIAAAELVPALRAQDDPRADDIAAHAVALGESMLAEQRGDDAPPPIRGSFGGDGRSTPSATRLEGLAALMRLLPTTDLRRARIAHAMASGTAFLRRCQLTKGELRGGVLRALAPRSDDDDFNERQAEIRIDYVQHALSAMLGFERLR